MRLSEEGISTCTDLQVLRREAIWLSRALDTLDGFTHDKDEMPVRIKTLRSLLVAVLGAPHEIRELLVLHDLAKKTEDYSDDVIGELLHAYNFYVTNITYERINDSN
jgi:hypothetical protein